MTFATAATAVLVSAATCYVVRRLLVRLEILVQPDARSSHRIPTPSGGGVGVMFGVMAGAAVAWHLTGRTGASLLFAGLGCAIIGLVDDLTGGVSAAMRLGFQILVVGTAVSLALENFSGPPAWRALFLFCCLVGGVGFVNIFNFMDGINGISAAETLVAGATLYLLGRHYGSPVVQQASLLSGAAILGFLPYNFPRARMFLGDVGSYFLGGWLGLIALITLRMGAPVEAVAGPFLLYVADAGSTLTRRVLRGAHVDTPHREHAYQRLAQSWGHPAATAFVFTLTSACAALGLVSIVGNGLLRMGADLLALGLVVAYVALPAYIARAVPHQPSHTQRSPLRAICVAGARPNLMKIKPLIDALEDVGIDVVFVHTGQHYDDALSGVFLEDLALRSPDRFLGVGSGTHAEQTARVMVEFEPVLSEVRPDVVIVVGDVNSTVGCALVSAKAGAYVAHVEAGLRSRDWSMPEEVNRLVTDRLSDYLFAPSPDAVENLRHEGFRSDQIHLAGNVMVDTLLTNVDRALARPVVGNLGLNGSRFGLVTLHRPANVDDPETLAALLATLGRISQDLPLVFPVHPRTRHRLGENFVAPGIILTDPLGYLDFLCLEAGASLVLTDSGGVQEETTVLGVPCLTLRESTERPITVSEGTNQVVGRESARILAAAEEVLRNGYRTRCPELWDGKASARIANVLIEDLPARRLRPSDLPLPA